MSRGLLVVLEEARSVGFLGPGPVPDHIRHARGFAQAAVAAIGAPRRFADLGSGGGVPALVLLEGWPEAVGALIESNSRRAAFLESALEELGHAGRVQVVADRAEEVARDSGHRERYPLVTARGFGPPPVTAEIAAGLVEVGGVLVVSEPPEPDPHRWPARELGLLGFGAPTRILAEEAHFVVIPKESPAPAERPRPTGRPAKRPLW